MPPELRDRDWLEAAYADRSAEAIARELGVGATAGRCDMINEWIQILELDRTLQLLRRMVQFDPADRDAAIAELDRLHAEIGDQPQTPS